MPTIAYAPSDHGPSADVHIAAGAVTVAGGCGVCHQIQVDEHSRPYIECDICAPIQMGGHWGWAATPHGVPLTPDENAARELSNRDATKARDDLANAAILEFMRQQREASKAAAPAAPSLADASPEQLLAALPADWQAALKTAMERAIPEDVVIEPPAAAEPGPADPGPIEVAPARVPAARKAPAARTPRGPQRKA
jgi:hypothetical protein